MDDAPSTALLMLDDLEVSDALDLIDDALTANRYVRTDYRPRPGHALAQDEWIGVVLTPIAEPRLVVALLADVSAVFRVALRLSERQPDRFIAAWRRFRGLDPCLKVFRHGRPLWKEGEDADHEVDWPVPTELPEAMHGYRDTLLPAAADEVPTLLRDTLRTHAEAIATPLEHEVAAGWIERRSPFAP